MKNLIACLLLSCSFLFGTSTITAGELDGGVEVMIVAYKTGQTVCFIELPKGYQPKNQTVEVSLIDEKGTLVHHEVSKDFTVSLSPSLSGNFNLTVKIDSFIFIKQINL